jgi:lipoprotein NlpD
VAKYFSERRAHLNSRVRIALLLAIVCAGWSSAAPSTNPNSRQLSQLFAHHAPRTASHIVAPGDTVYALARTYGISPNSLITANSLADPGNLRVGQMIIIPNGENDDAPLPATASAFGLGDPWSVPRADRQFKWPVIAGVVSSPFGIRNGAMHDGVDISAPVGTPVYAADDGNVIYAGVLHGYGNVVIIQHSGGYVTIYGHNQSNLVREGAGVARGQQIATIGTSGRTSGPNLHFEVRYNNQAQNPLAYLPAPNSTGISFARNGGS